MRVLLRVLRPFSSDYIWMHTDRNRAGKGTEGVTTARVAKLLVPLLLFVRVTIRKAVHLEDAQSIGR